MQQILLSHSWKNNNLLAAIEKNGHFDRVPKSIMHFGGTNNIFEDYNHDIPFNPDQNLEWPHLHELDDPHELDHHISER